MNLPTIWHEIDSALLWLANHDIWGLITTAVLIMTTIGGILYLRYAKRRVRNLNFFVSFKRENISDYPLKIYVEIRNYTGRSVVFTNPFFKFKDLRVDPQGRGDSSSGEIEVKFPDPNKQYLSEVEYMLRYKENVTTWIPLDPAHTDDEVKEALRQRRVGTLNCICAWLEDKPRIHKLRYSL
jgi:hypothetical protein